MARAWVPRSTRSAATGQADAIVAEDVADFPDLNLAESLQRIPGCLYRPAGRAR
jgi:iron complex outermembrane recepter protein